MTAITLTRTFIGAPSLPNETVAEGKSSVHGKSSRAARNFVANSRKQRAEEMQRIVFDAAAPLEANDSKKARMNRAWEALGRPDFWRVRAAWQGEAGAWKDEAVDDFRERAQALAIRRAADAVAASAQADPPTDVAAHLAGLVAVLEASDAEFHRPVVDALRWAISRCRG